LDILNRYFKGFYVPKNTFFEGTKKIFLCKKFFGTFCTCTKVACAKKKHWLYEQFTCNSEKLFLLYWFSFSYRWTNYTMIDIGRYHTCIDIKKVRYITVLFSHSQLTTNYKWTNDIQHIKKMLKSYFKILLLINKHV